MASRLHGTIMYVVHDDEEEPKTMPTETKHTPRPCAGREGVHECRVSQHGKVVWCDLHRAAPELLAALQGVMRIADRKTVEFDAARDAIAKALGK